jgi:hypothetical protein
MGRQVRDPGPDHARTRVTSCSIGGGGFTGAVTAYGGYMERLQYPRLYSDLAGWFHLLTAPSEYADEAALYRQLLESMGPIRTVLELGSGGGNNASHLKVHFQMTLVDVS